MSRKLLRIDFSCALLGGLLFLALFTYLQEKFGFPRWLVSTQLSANFLYAGFGLMAYIGKDNHAKALRILIMLNFIYAAFCVGMALSFVTESNLSAAMILAGEAALILGLALFERKNLGVAHHG